MLTRAWTCTVRLLRSWWQADRIRIPASQGLFLRLPDRCILMIDGVPHRMLSRIIGQGADRSYVLYECESADETIRLEASPGIDMNAPMLHLHRRGARTPIDAARINVIG